MVTNSSGVECKNADPLIFAPVCVRGVAGVHGLAFTIAPLVKLGSINTRRVLARASIRSQRGLTYEKHEEVGKPTR